MLPHWSISWWVTISLVIIIIWLFEASFKNAKKLQKENQQLNNKFKKSKKEETYFPRLNLHMLKEYAKLVVHKYQDLPIIRVTLYRCHSAFNLEMSAKYVILFIVDSNIKGSPELMERFETLLWATGYLQAIRDEDSSNYLGIDASFEDIYKEKPEKDFLKEWLFYAITSDEGLPLGIMPSEKNIILYKSRGN